MSKTAMAKNRFTFRAIALMLPAAALLLAGCGSSREEELGKELAKAKAEAQEAKAAQKLAEREAAEARDAIDKAPTIVEDDSESDDGEDTEDTDEPNAMDNNGPEAGPVENSDSREHRTVAE